MVDVILLQNQQRALLIKIDKQIDLLRVAVVQKNWATANGIIVDLISQIPANLIFDGDAFPLRYDLIVSQNHITAIIQEIEQDEITYEELVIKVLKILDKIKENVKINLSKIVLAPEEITPEPPKILTSFEMLGEFFKEKEKDPPIRLVGGITELNLQQSVKLLNSFEDYKDKVPKTINNSSNTVIFKGTIFGKMSFNIDKLNTVEDKSIKVMSQHWLFLDAYIIAINDMTDSASINSAISAHSSTQGEVYTIWDGGSWHMSGSDLLYFWLIRQDTYNKLRPIIAWIGFPFQFHTTDLEIKLIDIEAKIKNLEANREVFNKLIEDAVENSIRDNLVDIYNSLIKERYTISCSIKLSKERINILTGNIEKSINHRERIELKVKINETIESLKKDRKKVKEISDRITDILKERREIDIKLKEAEDSLRASLLAQDVARSQRQ